MKRAKESSGFTLIELMIVIAILSILMMIMIPNMIRSRDQAKLSSCQANLRNIAAALENYATENGGRYPEDLETLCPKEDASKRFMKSVPLCPVTGTKETYIKGYTMVVTPDDSYTVCCSGENHAILGIPANYPSQNAASGLEIRPHEAAPPAGE